MDSDSSQGSSVSSLSEVSRHVFALQAQTTQLERRVRELSERLIVCQQSLQEILQILPVLSERIGRSEESLAVAEHSFDNLQSRLSNLESWLNLDALD